MIRGVVFDLDGVLIDSEHLWDGARRALVSERGGRWSDEATGDMQGMSSPEWSTYMRDRLGVDLDPGKIDELVVAQVLRRYEADLPLLPGAPEAVERLASRWPLALASSANRVVIDRVLAVAGLGAAFAVTVSSEEVDRGKPAPEVYLEAARRLGLPPGDCAAVEDSGNGILAAAEAGLAVVTLPNRRFPPPPEALALAQVVIDDLAELTVEMVESLGSGYVDEEEVESFPASDPHSDWAGDSET